MLCIQAIIVLEPLLWHGGESLLYKNNVNNWKLNYHTTKRAFTFISCVLDSYALLIYFIAVSRLLPCGAVIYCLCIAL